MEESILERKQVFYTTKDTQSMEATQLQLPTVLIPRNHG